MYLMKLFDALCICKHTDYLILWMVCPVTGKILGLYTIKNRLCLLECIALNKSFLSMNIILFQSIAHGNFCFMIKVI